MKSLYRFLNGKVFGCIERNKAYLVLICALVVFMGYSAIVFYYIQDTYFQSLKDNAKLVAEKYQYKFHYNMSAKVRFIYNLSKELESKHLHEGFPLTKEIQDSKIIYTSVFYPDKEFYINAQKADLNQQNIDFYQDILDSGVITNYLEYNNSHYLLKIDAPMDIPQFHICMPIVNSQEGLFCGVINLATLFEESKDEDSNDFDVFITDANLSILMGDFQNEQEKQKTQDLLFAQSQDFVKVGILHLSPLDLYIGAIPKNQNVLYEQMDTFIWYGVALLIAFIVLVAIINECYEYLRKRFEAKQKEYESFLAYHSKIIEISENLGAMAHQLTQPINSISVVASSICLELNALSVEEIQKRLDLIKSCVNMADSTIDIFKRLYKNDEDIREFDVKKSFENVANILQPSLTLAKINIQNHIQEVMIYNYENLYWQVLMVLLNNAKDAIIESKNNTKNTIIVESKEDEKYIYIFVSDYGIGIPKKAREKIFSSIYTSKKAIGTGLGLYFAYRIARQKLGGDIRILKESNPTIFELKIQKTLYKQRSKK